MASLQANARVLLIAEPTLIAREVIQNILVAIDRWVELSPKENCKVVAEYMKLSTPFYCHSRPTHPLHRQKIWQRLLHYHEFALHEFALPVSRFHLSERAI